MTDKFIKDNKDALIQEMATAITNLNNIIAETIDAPITPESDGLVMRTYMVAIGMQVGSLTSLFNQYYIMLQGNVVKEKIPGFAGLIKNTPFKATHDED